MKARPYGFVALFFCFVGCSVTLPEPLVAPEVSQPIGSVRVEIPRRGQYLTRRVLTVPGTNGASPETREIEIPIKQAIFFDVLEANRIANAYQSEGATDYRIVFEEFRASPNKLSVPIITTGVVAIIVLPFGSALSLVPWPDYADARIKVTVYDDQNRPVETIEEAARYWYCNWGPLLLTQHAWNKSQSLYRALNDRVAVRTIQAMEADRLRRGPAVQAENKDSGL